MQEQITYANGEVITDRNRFRTVAYLQIAISLLALASGAFIVIGNILNWIQALTETTWLVLPEGIALYGIHGLASLVLGYFALRIGIAINRMEMWAFSSMLYTNILLEIVLLTSTLGIATAVLIFEGIRWSNILVIALAPSL
ncbi:MAG: hypothetical protein ACW99H_05310, partial [Candidatus Thorarchaeota archaeon]